MPHLPFGAAASEEAVRGGHAIVGRDEQRESRGDLVNDRQENGLPRLSSELSDDPHETIIQLLSTLPTIITSSPTPISDASRMAADRDVVSEINLPRLCRHYISGANDFLVTLEQILTVDSS